MRRKLHLVLFGLHDAVLAKPGSKITITLFCQLGQNPLSIDPFGTDSAMVVSTFRKFFPCISSLDHEHKTSQHLPGQHDKGHLKGSSGDCCSAPLSGSCGCLSRFSPPNTARTSIKISSKLTHPALLLLNISFPPSNVLWSNSDPSRTFRLLYLPKPNNPD